MPTSDPATADLLARYLDGMLAGEELSSFQRRLQTDARLRAEVETLHGVDAALRRNFSAAPAMTAAQVLALANQIVPRTATTSSTTATASHSNVLAHLTADPLRRLAYAAVLIGGLFGVWTVWQHVKPDPTARMIQTPSPTKNAATYYNTTLAAGFKPEWQCDSDKQFAETFRDRFGQALQLTPSSDGTHMLGLAYAPVFSPKTIGVLGEAEGESVLVLIDNIAADNPELVYPDCASLQVYRREIGTLVMYEFSPLPKSHMLDLLVQPTQSPNRGG